MTLTKARIVGAFAEQNGYTKKQIFDIVEILLGIIKKILVFGHQRLLLGGKL